MKLTHESSLDNMPVTWCYQGEPGQQYCSTGFPMGCYLPKTGKPKDACAINVLNKIKIFYRIKCNKFFSACI